MDLDLVLLFSNWLTNVEVAEDVSQVTEDVSQLTWDNSQETEDVSQVTEDVSGNLGCVPR